jgi:hypothetical protein
VILVQQFVGVKPDEVEPGAGQGNVSVHVIRMTRPRVQVDLASRGP